MNVLKWDLWGWKQIAAALNVGTTTAQTWALITDDPLPVDKFHGQVVAQASEVEAWAERWANRFG